MLSQYNIYVKIKTMKIAIFSDAYLDVTGGIVSSIEAQKEALEKAGYQVTIFSPGFPGRKREAGVVVVPICRYIRAEGVPLARNPRVVRKFIVQQFPDFEFDLVHVHYEAGCSLAGMKLAREFGLPLVVTMHGREDAAVATNVPWPFKTLAGTLLNWFHSWYLPHTVRVPRDDYLAKTLARAKMWTLMVNHANYADLVLTPSQHFKRKLKHYGVKKPIRVLSNGIADTLMPKSVMVRKWSGKEPLKLFWNSRVSREKRIMEFLKALKLVEFPYEMLVYGGGNELKKAQNFARVNRLRVKFFGSTPRKELLGNLKKAHLGVLASYDFDSQGMTLLEARAFGLPVLICDPDLTGVVGAGSYVLSKGPDAVAMAEALMELSRHPERIAKMSAKMIERRAEVAQSRMLKDLVEIYQKQIEKSVKKQER